MKPFTGVRILVVALFALIVTAQSAQAGPAGRLRFGTGGGVVVDIPDEATLAAKLSQYAATATPVTLRLASGGDFSGSRSICVVGPATVTIEGNPAAVRQIFGPVALCTGANAITFKHLHHYSSTTGTSATPILLISAPTGFFLGANNITSLDSDFSGPTFSPYGDYAAISNVPTYVKTFIGSFNNLIVRDAYFHHLHDAFKPLARTGYFELSRSLCDMMYEDCFSVGVNEGITRIVIERNFATRFAGRGTDCANPHADALGQIYTTSGQSEAPILNSARDQGNVVFGGAARGAPQGMFSAGNAAGSEWRDIEVTDNIYAADDPTQTSFNAYATNCSGVLVPQTVANGGDKSPGVANFVVGGNFSRNRAVRTNPGQGTGVMAANAVGIAGRVPPLMADNLGETVSAGNAVTTENMTVGTATTRATLSEMQAAFDGPFDFTTGVDYDSRAGLWALRDRVVAAYACKVDGICGRLRGVYDYSTGVIDYSKTRSFIGMQPYLAQIRSATIETPWLKIYNGGPTQAITPIAGVSYQISNASDGSGATSYTTSPGTVNEGQYLRLTRAASASYATTVQLGAIIGTTLNAVPVTTDSSVAFAEVDNGGTAYSVATTPASEPNQVKAVIAFRTKYDTYADSKVLFNQAGAGNGFNFQSVAGHPRLQFRTSGSGQIANIQSSDTAWHIDVFAIDYTATVKVDVIKWWRDGVRQETPVSSATPCAPPASCLVFNPSSTLAQIAAFATSAGANIVDGQISYLWMHWGDAALNLPDFGIPANLDKFLADNINLTNGSGPLGFSPKVFFYGSVADWNTGLSNKGTAVDAGAAPLVLTKAAGTYN